MESIESPLKEFGDSAAVNFHYMTIPAGRDVDPERLKDGIEIMVTKEINLEVHI